MKLILWGSSWVSSPGDKIFGLELFYQGWSGSSYANTVTEYTGTNGKVTNKISYAGYVIDSSNPITDTSTGSILQEVCRMIPNQEPSGNGYYVVYTELPRGSANFCGYHSHGYCGGVQVQFSLIFNVDNDDSCTIGLPPSNPGWQMSRGMHCLSSVTAHELAEMVTDPDSYSGWMDSYGMENGDKCASKLMPTDTVFSNGITWRIPGQWSNAAAIAKSGYATISAGLKVYGCIGSA